MTRTQVQLHTQGDELQVEVSRSVRLTTGSDLPQCTMYISTQNTTSRVNSSVIVHIPNCTATLDISASISSPTTEILFKFTNYTSHEAQQSKTASVTVILILASAKQLYNYYNILYLQQPPSKLVAVTLVAVRNLGKWADLSPAIQLNLSYYMHPYQPTLLPIRYFTIVKW